MEPQFIVEIQQLQKNACSQPLSYGRAHWGRVCFLVYSTYRNQKKGFAQGNEAYHITRFMLLPRATILSINIASAYIQGRVGKVFHTLPSDLDPAD